MPDLKRYREKRDPEATPEPYFSDPRTRALPPAAARMFVVQQHDARNMHWDLRLEIDGVLVSWAIPRGPSLDPAQRRLAVQTEDHPLEYADFEGVIPKGNYGAGGMIVWDRGIYHTADGVSPRRALEIGKLDLALQGHKLRGRFALVRTRGEGGKNWLLISKMAAPAEREEVVELRPASVYSGLTVHELRDGASRDDEVAALLEQLGAKPATLDPKRLRPMLASRESRPFSREGWLFELKYDGVRLLAEKRGERVRLFARKGAERTGTYPDLAEALAHLPLDSFILDGEVVALDPSGRSSFELLQRRFTQTDPDAIALAQLEVPVVLYAFDLLAALGHDLRELPLSQRKQVLASFVPASGVVRFADHVEGDGVALFEASSEHGLEGIVAKDASSRYETAQRSKRWIKIKVPRLARLAIAGWMEGRGSRRALGSLVLAWHRDGALVYAGNAGSGLDDATLERLREELSAQEIPSPAFEGAPEVSSRPLHYTRPELVCEVRFTEVTSAGLLRHPVFVGLCEGVRPEECVAPANVASAEDALAQNVESAAGVAAPRAETLELTRLEKVFWPVEGYTKGDLLAYYESVWPWLEPYLGERPVVLTRYPDGIEGKYFYQKNAPDFTPDWARREQIEGTDYFICNDLRTLLYVINSGAIPLHVWSARLGSLERPDWLILDLDPKQAPFSWVIEIARRIHRLLAELDVPHFAKTSGQDGLHVLLPLGAQLDHGEAKALGEVLARVVVADLPEIATIARPVAARADKVYVDYLQNGRGKLIAAPFSVRPRAGAPVSTPLSWRQVSSRLDPSHWTIRTTPPAMRKRGDPMRGLLDARVDVESLLARLLERLAETAPGGGA